MKTLAATAALCAALMAGCGGAHRASTTKLTAAHSTSSATTSAAQVPNPFKIVARFSAASLGLTKPLDLAVGPDGNVYVTDASDQVVVVSPAGKVLRRWGETGSGPGEFLFVDPSDINGTLRAPIAVGPDGKVYVADRGNHRVEVFSPAGQFVRQFGSFGTGSDLFTVILGLAVDSAGSAYVADDAQQTLSKFSPAGRLEWSIGGRAAVDPDLQAGFELANVDRHGRVVAGIIGRSIIYIDPSGHKVDAFPVTAYFRNGWGPCDVTVDSQGDVAVESCPDAAHPLPGVPSYRATLIFDRTHRLIGAWYGNPFSDFVAPRFGPHDEAFAIGAEIGTADPNGPILKLKVTLPGG